jgi:hypothetical protein
MSAAAVADAATAAGDSGLMVLTKKKNFVTYSEAFEAFRLKLLKLKKYIIV